MIGKTGDKGTFYSGEKGTKMIGVDTIGSKRKWIKGGPTKKDAERELNENIQTVQEGAFMSVKKVSFTDFSKIWIESHVKANIKETVYDDYVYTVGRLAQHFGEARLQNITGAHLQAFIAKRMEEVQASSVQHETIILKEMLKHAYQWGYTKRNPGEFIKNPRVTKKKVSILDLSEVNKLIDNVHEHYHVAVLTASLTGLRANELWGLTWNDIDLSNNVIHVRHSLWKGKLYEPKTETSRRNVDISGSLALALKKWKLQCPVSELNFVFPSRRGLPVNHAKFVRNYFKPALVKAELVNVKWHSLRHTNASIRIKSEQNAKYLSSQLGHSSIQITYDLYGHLFTDAEFSRSQVEKLETAFYGC